MNKELIRLLGATANDELIEEMDNALDEMEQELEKICDCKDKALSEDLKRVVTSGGKRLRPILTYLGYKIGKADPDRNSSDYPIVPLMAAMELIHTSSLIHDDIIDNASVRRSVPTINATSGDHIAVQAGDYLLSKAIAIMGCYSDLHIDRHFTMMAKGMCEAEFMQMNSANKFNRQSLNVYFEQIKRKTAAFIAVCTAIGGEAGGASEKTIQMLDEFGMNAGIAFQIRDDVLDFASGEGFGKKCGQDLERGIFTLPLIHALNGRNDAGADLGAMKKLATAKTKSEADVNLLLDFVKNSGGIEEAQKEIANYTEKAAEALTSVVSGKAKDALLALASGLAVRCI